MLKLKLQYFGHLMWRADSFEKTPMLGKMKVGGEGDNSRWDGWMVSPTQWTWVWANSGSWWMTGTPGMLQSMGLQRVGLDCLNWLSLIPFWLKFTLFFATSQTPISWKPYVGKNLILEAETPDFKFQLHNQVTKTFWTCFPISENQGYDIYILRLFSTLNETIHVKVLIVYKTSFTFFADLLQDLKEKLSLEVPRRGMDHSRDLWEAALTAAQSVWAAWSPHWRCHLCHLTSLLSSVSHSHPVPPTSIYAALLDTLCKCYF